MGKRAKSTAPEPKVAKPKAEPKQRQAKAKAKAKPDPEQPKQSRKRRAEEEEVKLPVISEEEQQGYRRQWIQQGFLKPNPTHGDSSTGQARREMFILFLR